MKPTLSSIRLSALIATAIVALAACGEKQAASKETKPAAAAKPAAGQAAKPAAPKPKEINLLAVLKVVDLKKALGLDEAAKVGVDTKNIEKGSLMYIWLKPDHEEIKKKNDEVLKKVAEQEAAGKTVAPEDKKLTAKHFVVSVNYGKALPTPVAAKKNLEARMQGVTKLAAEPNSTVTVEDVAGLADGAFWRGDASVLVFAKGTWVVTVGTGGADTAKAKEWAIAVAKAVASKLP